MKFSWSLLAFVFLPAFTVAVIEIKDITIYKPCIVDSTVCPHDQLCFQYFCYPKTAKAADPLKSCSKNSHCDGWKPSKTEKCAKQGRNGVCVPSEDYETCEAHEDCEDRGEKCCGDYCCNEEYFDALQKLVCPEGDVDCEAVKKTMIDQEIDQEKRSLDCTTDELCEEKHNGHKCCEDNSLLKNITFSDPMENWGGSKRCCMSATKLRKLSDVDKKTNYG